MYYPTLEPENVTRDYIDVFGGYNHNYRIKDNEFYDMKNMTSDCYPLLASRGKRGISGWGTMVTGKIRGMIYKTDYFFISYESDGSVVVDPDTDILTLWQSGAPVKTFTLGDGADYRDGNRQLIFMGTYLVIFPDKIYVNTAAGYDEHGQYKECGKIEAETMTLGDIYINACDTSGNILYAKFIQDEVPQDPRDGDVWLDTSSEIKEYTYKKYYSSNQTWQTLPSNYCRINTQSDVGINDLFKVGDCVKISGVTDRPSLNTECIIEKIIPRLYAGNEIYDIVLKGQFNSAADIVSYVCLENGQVEAAIDIACASDVTADDTTRFKGKTFSIRNKKQECTTNTAAEADPDSPTGYKTTVSFASTFDGIVKGHHLNLWTDTPSATKQIDPITISRKTPVMDFVIESKNRLWGCRYGMNANNEFVNEIYCSKLGDFKNWNVYEGISTDSYAASCGTDGKWTGAVNYLGQPIFFKENYIHTVYGSYPSQFQINSMPARGIMKGSENSLVQIEEALYYLSSDGVMVYTGSLPSAISSAFGNIKYKDGIACGYDGKYYICVKDGSNNKSFFVYDTKLGTWHKHDDLYVDLMCSVTNKDIFYTITTDTKLHTLFGTGTKEDDDVEWYVESGLFGLDMPDSKYISRLNIRLSLDLGSNLIVSAQYDNSDEWEMLCEIRRPDINPFTLPIKPRRCDRFRLRLEGTGGVKVYSISKTIEQGSDKK